MAYVVDVYEPWLGEGYSTYDAEGFAQLEGAPVKVWVQALRAATLERGGEIVYEGDPDTRPQWLKEAYEAQSRGVRSTPHQANERSTAK